MTQANLFSQGSLRWELGRLKSEQHDLEATIREMEVKLRSLKNQRDFNKQRIHAIHKALLAGLPDEALCRQEDGLIDCSHAMMPGGFSALWLDFAKVILAIVGIAVALIFLV